VSPVFSLDEQRRHRFDEDRRLAREVLEPIARSGPEGRVNRALVKALGDQGILARLFPKRVGGVQDQDVSAVELCLLREALAMECVEAETALAMQGLGGYPILQSGTEALVERYVVPLARGEAIGALALTEPEHGSDAGAIETIAARDGDDWRLTGTKAWISNAPDADIYVLFARTTPDAKARGVTAFVVPGDSAGLSGEPIELLSPHPVGRLELDGVRVPNDHVLGEIDAGFKVAMATLDLFRPSVGAFAVGLAEAALEAATEHADHRQAFGKPIREFQAVSHLLAEMATRTVAAWLLVYEAAVAYDTESDGLTLRSAMAKLAATETAQFVVDAALQIHGAAGLQRGHLLERLYREVRAPRIYEGTSEIQREIIARELFRRTRGSSIN
jgi:alkylation response protein AidB-like acyl-CoA dehydrogenase